MSLSMHKFCSSILTIGLIAIIFACAKQTSPTGGPKDTIPPRLINSLPRHEALNSNPTTITLEFTEHIILANPKEQIIITPDIQKKYEITAKRTRVIMQLENKLDSNTTYSINFRDAVQDITEKNPARNLRLAFSTGSYIDSLSISGTVRDLFQNKEVKDATVALFQSDTFDIFKHKPVYLTKTNDKGEYSIENLKHGIYYIYAFDDKNRNLIVDSKSEVYGFRADSLNLDQSVENINIFTTKLDARPLTITSARPNNTYFNIRTSKGLHDYEILSPANDTLYTTFGEDRANIRIYNTLPQRDSSAIQFLARDSLGNTIDTTLYVKFSQRQTRPESFSAKIDQTTLLARTAQFTARASITKPITEINYDSALIQLDSVNTLTFLPEEITVDNKNRTIDFQKAIPRTHLRNEATTPQQVAQAQTSTPKISISIYFGKGTFRSVENDSSAVISQSLRPIYYEDTGLIIAAVNTDRPNWIIQLTDKSYKVIRQSINQKQVTFNDLPPGDYFLRAVDDTDGDGAWTPGNFYEKREPEKIYYYSNEKQVPLITLKANFELGPLLITF